MEENEDFMEAFYVPEVFSKLFIDQSQQISEKNLSFDRKMIAILDDFQKLEPDPKRLLDTISAILNDMDSLYKIRTALLIFAFRKHFDIYTYFSSILSEDFLGHENSGKHPIFNDIFYHNLAIYPDLMISVIESIYEFNSTASLQYNVIYPIINSIIIANENSDLPIKTKELNFMKIESVTEDYKKSIKKSYPIILPFPIKYKDYTEEPEPPLSIGLRVQRNDVLSTIFHLETFADVLNGKFRVEFIGEDGIDCGGLSREFVDIGWKALDKSPLFRHVDNKCTWFNYIPNPSEEILNQYKNVGIFFGLCIKNNIQIPIRFPVFFYKKLMNRNFSMYDLSLYDEEIGKHINHMLYNDITEEDGYDLTFIIKERCIDGNNIGHEFDISREYPNFVDITNNNEWEVTPVDNKNKFDYVLNLFDLIFKFSVEKQYDKFLEGFLMVSQSEMLETSFRLDELDILISGELNIDWALFKRKTRSHSNDQSVRWFWEIFDEFTEDQKLRFLKFITGTTAIPIDGFASAEYYIYSTDYNPNHPYPISHTCFNQMELPRYPTKEEERTVLTNILENLESITFGLA